MRGTALDTDYRQWSLQEALVIVSQWRDDKCTFRVVKYGRDYTNCLGEYDNLADAERRLRDIMLRLGALGSREEERDRRRDGSVGKPCPECGAICVEQPGRPGPWGYCPECGHGRVTELTQQDFALLCGLGEKHGGVTREDVSRVVGGAGRTALEEPLPAYYVQKVVR